MSVRSPDRPRRATRPGPSGAPGPAGGTAARPAGVAARSVRSARAGTVVPSDDVPPPEPVWFGRPEAPLFGWVHRPAGASAGAAVLCPPLFTDAAPAHPAYVRVARRLQAHGLTVVRFDYRGTGDSAGDLPASGGADPWAEDVGVALALARSVSSGPVALAGLQMGALLAAVAAARDGGVDALALWDPCTSGQAFLRRQRLLQSMRGAPDPPTGRVEVPGAVLTAALADGLRALRLPERPPAEEVLVLVRPERAGDVALWLGAPAGGAPAGPVSVEVEEVPSTAQEAFLEVDPLDSEVPGASADRLAGWLAATLHRRRGEGAGRRPLTGTGSWRTSGAVTLGTASDGGDVVERARRLGPLGLFGIETVRRDLGDDPGSADAVVVFLSSGADVHTGPSRLWVTLARRWAEEGVRCVRVDLSGLGDSPARPGQAEHVLRPPEAFDDVADVVKAVASDPRRVVLVGLCSGAYQALESALELPVLGVLAVNPALRFTPPELLATGRVSARRRICVTRPPWMESTRSRLPRSVGALAGALRIGWRRVRPYAGADAWKAELVRRGVDVYCVCGEAEARPLVGPAVADRWPGSGRFRVETVPGMDHALLVGSDRVLVTDRLTEELHRCVAAARTPGTGAV